MKVAKPIKDELAIEPNKDNKHPAPTVGVERVCLVRCRSQWAWLQHVLKMSSFKKREKALRRTHRERAQVGYGGTDEP